MSKLLHTLFIVAALTASAQRPALPEGKFPLVDAPWSNDADKFSFVILGDKTSGGEGKWPIYDRAVDAINLLEPDFVITVGDMIPGHMQERAVWDAEWAEYMEHAQRIDAPLFFTVGNHDIANTECYGFWQEDFGRTYYSFDYKNCHFLALNTEEERFDGRGPRWEAMMSWMEADLERAAGARHTFIFFHKPMWDDPRFEDDWARVERALGARPFTVVAGHEHYLATERRGGNLYVVQNATGGGINLSDVKEFGCFHGFGFVTVDGNDVTYAIVEPEGGIWPVDVAPMAFRKAVNHDLAQVDTVSHAVAGDGTVTLDVVATLHNVLEDEATIRLRVEPVSDAAWSPRNLHGWERDGNAIVAEATLAPGARAGRPLTFMIAPAAAGFPPAIACDVRYQGAWLEKEAMPMEEMAVVPLHPRASYRPVPEWQLVGPFPIGPIDTSALPDNPAAANPNLMKRLGPENGFDADAAYDGLRWQRVRAHANGLINTNALLGTVDEAVAYALGGVYSPEAQTTHVAVYADNFAQVFVNGSLVESVQEMGWAGGYVFVPVELHAGWNTLIVKIINNKADWFARVLVADPNNNLRFAAAPE